MFQRLLVGLVIFGTISAIRVPRRSDLLGDFGLWSPDSEDEGLSALESKYSEESKYKESKYSEDDDSKSVEAAIKTKRYNRVVPTHDEDEEVITRVIKVEPSKTPVKILYKTESNPVTIEQMHTPSKATHEETSSEDEPHRVTHRVFRPVIQEIKEIIQPYRRIRQEVRPVLEEIRTVVHKRDQKERGRKRDEDDQHSNDGDKYERQQQQYKKKSSLESLSDYDSSEDDKKGSYKPKYQSDMESNKRRDDKKETRKYSRSRQESSGKEQEEYKKKKNEEEGNDKKKGSERRQSKPMMMRAPALPALYSMSDDDSEGDKSDSRPKYQDKRTIEYSDDISSILEQMNKLNLMAASTGDHYNIGASQPEMMRASPNMPILSLNSGKINLSRRSGRQFNNARVELIDQFGDEIYGLY